MKVDAIITWELDKAGAQAKELEAMGYAGLKSVETAHDPFLPLLMAALCAWLEASPLVSAFAILCAAMPSSPSGYLVAKQLGGDSELMATIITFQTLVSMVTVTLWGTYAVSLLGTGP